MIFDILRGLTGIILLLAIAWVFSSDKRNIPWRIIFTGVGLQAAFGVFLLKGTSLAEFWSPLGWPKAAFDIISKGFIKLLAFTMEGAQFVFGPLAMAPGTDGSFGYVMAFQTLTTVIFFGMLTAMLYHMGVMQRVVQAIAWVMAKVMRTSGAESLSNAANIFVGLAEAPLIIRPYLEKLTRSELLTIMIGGLATIAGGVMAAYIHILGMAWADVHGIAQASAQAMFASHLLGASVMSAPAAIVISKIMLPETLTPETFGTVKAHIERRSSNLIDAATQGASDGVKLAINIAAMLIAFIALVALVNYLLGTLGTIGGINAWCESVFHRPLSIELLFGAVLQYVAYGIGIPWGDAFHVGSLLGTKLAVNEFVAYIDMAELMRMGVLTSEKTIMITSFALCGFSNFGSIAILIGGLGPLAPNQRGNITALSMRAMLGGMLATLMTATIAGAMYAL